MKVVVGVTPMVEMKMLRWNSLILVFVIGVGCCANAFGQREVTNFPSQLQDAIVAGSDISKGGISERTWLKADIDDPSKKPANDRVANLPKPDKATVAPRSGGSTNFSDETSQPKTISPETRKEIEEKIRTELEEKFQSQIEQLVRKQVRESQGSKTVRFGGPTLVGEILPVVPAKGYLLTDYTLRQKRAVGQARLRSSGASANFNDSNRRPATSTLKNGPMVEGSVAAIPLAKAEAPKPPTTPVSTKEPSAPTTAQVNQRIPQQSEQDQVTLLPPLPSIELKNNESNSLPNSFQNAKQNAVAGNNRTQVQSPNATPTALPFDNADASAPPVPPGSENQISVLKRPQQNALRSSVVGPEFLGIGQAETFEIIVANQSGADAKEVVVQLTVPDAITISQLDREAYLDRDNRTISWRVAQIPGQSKEVIRYKATSRTLGQHPQTVRLGMDNTLQGVTPFTTVVTQTPSSTIQLPSNNPPAAEVAKRPTVEK